MTIQLKIVSLSCLHRSYPVRVSHVAGAGKVWSKGLNTQMNTSLTEQDHAKPVSLRHALDEGRWTAFQKRVAGLAILAVVLDGFDIQLLGVAIPALMKAWNLPREAFVPVLGLGLIAMSVGTAVSGWLGDRFGRKVTLLGAMVLFGAGTLLALPAKGMVLFTISRLIASLGLGGAFPTAVALLSEFTPVRRRSFMVTFGMICTPVGGVMAGLVSAWLLPEYGWSSLFVVGGILPLALAVLVGVFLPESPQFLASRPGRSAALARIGRKMGLSADVPLEQGFELPGERPKAGYAALVAPGELLPSLLLCLQFFGVLTAAYTVFNWLPTLSVSLGLSMAVGGSLLAAFNFGGMAGALIGALSIDRHGSRWLTLLFAIGGSVASVGALFAFAPGASYLMLFAAMFVTGTFIAGLQPMLFAIAANAYPARIRSTGVGTALAIGRLGAIASSFIGAMLVGAGAKVFFVFLCLTMLVVAVALAAMPRHVPARGRIATGV